MVLLPGNTDSIFFLTCGFLRDKISLVNEVDLLQSAGCQFSVCGHGSFPSPMQKQ